MFSPFVRTCTLLHAGSVFSCNTLIYKQLTQILLAVALAPATALGQVTFSKEVAPIGFGQ